MLDMDDATMAHKLGIDVSELAFLELYQKPEEILRFKNFVGAYAQRAYLFGLLSKTLEEHTTSDNLGGKYLKLYI